MYASVRLTLAGATRAACDDDAYATPTARRRRIPLPPPPPTPESRVVTDDPNRLRLAWRSVLNELGCSSRDVTAAELLETMADILRQRNITVDEAIRTTMMSRVDVVALFFGEFLDAL